MLFMVIGWTEYINVSDWISILLHLKKRIFFSLYFKIEISWVFHSHFFFNLLQWKLSFIGIIIWEIYYLDFYRRNNFKMEFQTNFFKIHLKFFIHRFLPKRYLLHVSTCVKFWLQLSRFFTWSEIFLNTCLHAR